MSNPTKRPSEAELRARFADMHPPLDDSQAVIEADRCYFCYDAPCTTACPTGIDIPQFIQKIRSGNIEGSAETILSENILGGMCARVCPTEVLCEEACVRNTHEDKPVAIGLLQRHATDPIIEADQQLFDRAKDSGFRVAVVGAGPAGLSCAHRLSMLGHQVVLFDQADKLGGLNEYGIAAYKTVDGFAQREVEYVLGIGGIECRRGVLGQDLQLSVLREKYDAVFIGAGLGDVNDLGLKNDDRVGVIDAVDYIAELRQADDLSKLKVGRDVVVIGGGMTAIDIAVQSKKLGAENVTIAYRRGPEQMNASPYEQKFAQQAGVRIRHWLSPEQICLDDDDNVAAVLFEYTDLHSDGTLKGAGELVEIPADTVFKAIGQRAVFDDESGCGIPAQLVRERGRIKVDEHRKTSLADVWAGGDCIYGGEDLTVSAVQDGKIAAHSIDAHLREQT